MLVDRNVGGQIRADLLDNLLADRLSPDAALTETGEDLRNVCAGHLDQHSIAGPLGPGLFKKLDRFAAGGGNSAACQQRSVLAVKIDQRLEVIGKGLNLSNPAYQQIPLSLGHQKAG